MVFNTFQSIILIATLLRKGAVATAPVAPAPVETLCRLGLRFNKLAELTLRGVIPIETGFLLLLTTRP